MFGSLHSQDLSGTRQCQGLSYYWFMLESGTTAVTVRAGSDSVLLETPTFNYFLTHVTLSPTFLHASIIIKTHPSFHLFLTILQTNTYVCLKPSPRRSLLDVTAYIFQGHSLPLHVKAQTMAVAAPPPRPPLGHHGPHHHHHHHPHHPDTTVIKAVALVMGGLGVGTLLTILAHLLWGCIRQRWRPAQT